MKEYKSKIGKQTENVMSTNNTEDNTPDKFETPINWTISKDAKLIDNLRYLLNI